MVEYQCRTCGVFESLEDRPAPQERPCKSCGAPAGRILSAVKGKICWAWVDQGPSEAPPPGALRTDHLVK